MAKYRERLRARELRKNGESVGGIAELLGVSKSSVSLWCRDIVLTKKQVARLMRKEFVGSVRGRMKAWESHRQEKLERVDKFRKKGMTKLGNVSDRELFVIGLALYWAEGSKKDGVVSLVNSDIAMMILFVEWLEKCFGVKKENLICRVGINEVHKDRVSVVEEYWSDKLRIPLDQFRPTSLKKVNNKKIYANHNTHYGSLVIKVRKSTNMFYEILGSIAGLKREVEVKSSL